MMQNSDDAKKYPAASIGDHIQSINSLTSSHAMEIYGKGIRCRLSDVLFKPCIVLLKSMLIELHIFRGIRGIIVSVLEAYEEFLTRLKLWEIQNTGKRYEK